MKKSFLAVLFAVCLFILMSFSAFAAEDIVWDFDDNTVQNWIIGNVDSHSVENGVLKLNLSETVGDAQIKVAANVSTSAYRYIGTPSGFGKLQSGRVLHRYQERIYTAVGNTGRHKQGCYHSNQLFQGTETHLLSKN